MQRCFAGVAGRVWGRSGAVCTCSPERRIHHDAEVVSGTTATGMVAPDGGAPRGSWGQQPSWGRTPSWGSGPGDVHWGWGPPASGRRAFHSGASPGHTPGLSPFTHSLTLCTHSRRGRLGVTWSTRTRGSRLDATRALPLGRLRRGGAGKLAPRRQRRQLSSPRRGPERGRAGPSGAERRRAAPRRAHASCDRDSAPGPGDATAAVRGQARAQGAAAAVSSERHLTPTRAYAAYAFIS